MARDSGSRRWIASYGDGILLDHPSAQVDVVRRWSRCCHVPARTELSPVAHVRSMEKCVCGIHARSVGGVGGSSD